MTNQPTNEQLRKGTELLDLVARLGEQTAILTQRLDALESALRKMHEANALRDEALAALSRNVEMLAALLAGADVVLQAPDLH